MKRTDMQDEVVRLLPIRHGHFRLESGHHGNLWLDLELLCLRLEPIRRLARQIAIRLATHHVEAICGPLIEGAFVALMAAEELGVPFTYAERFADRERKDKKSDVLYPVEYRLPRALREMVRGKRVAIANDVINAGSAIRGTFSDLRACGAEPVAIAALAILGQSAAEMAAEHNLALETMAYLPNEIWAPAECPLCVRRIPVEDFLAPKAGVA
jgi:orotate phosphoribosyltransferase